MTRPRRQRTVDYRSPYSHHEKDRADMGRRGEDDAMRAERERNIQRYTLAENMGLPLPYPPREKGE